jgi:hypothetical protein
MPKRKFSISRIDESLRDLVGKTDHRTLGIWAKECAERILPFFEKEYPSDERPRNALAVLQAWIDTGEFNMTKIRRVSLSSHAAAREVGEDNPARSAARAAGQAVATAHVSTHSLGAAIYTLQAIHRAADPQEADSAVDKERDRQFRRLIELSEKSVSPGDRHRLYRSRPSSGKVDVPSKSG